MKLIILVLVTVLIVQQGDCQSVTLDFGALLRNILTKSASTSAASSASASAASSAASSGASSQPRRPPPPRPTTTTTTTTTTTQNPFNLIFRNIFEKSNSKVPQLQQRTNPPPPPPQQQPNGPTRVSLPVARPMPPLSMNCGGAFAIPFFPCGNIPQPQQPAVSTTPAPPQTQPPPAQQQPPQQQPPQQQPQAPPCENNLGLPFDICGDFPQSPPPQQDPPAQDQPTGQAQPPPDQQQGQVPDQPAAAQPPENPPQPNEIPQQNPDPNLAANPPPNPNACNENQPPFYCYDFIPQRPSYENDLYGGQFQQAPISNNVFGAQPRGGSGFGYSVAGNQGFMYYTNTHPSGQSHQEYRYFSYH